MSKSVQDDAEECVSAALRSIVQHEFSAAVRRCNDLQARIQMRPLGYIDHVNVASLLHIVRGLALAYLRNWHEASADLELAVRYVESEHFAPRSLPSWLQPFAFFVRGYTLMGAYRYERQHGRLIRKGTVGLNMAAIALMRSSDLFRANEQTGSWSVRAMVLKAQIYHYLQQEAPREGLAGYALTMPEMNESNGMDDVKQLAVWLARPDTMNDAIAPDMEPWEADMLDLVEEILSERLRIHAG